MGGITLPTASTPGYTTLPAKYGPDVACICDATWWPVFVRFLRFKGKPVPDLWQAVGANALSGNTHAGGGTLDWSGIDSETVMYAREAGRSDTWPRPWLNADGTRNYHSHSVATGCPHLSDAARLQLGEVRERDDGLAADGPDSLPAPKTYRTWQQGVVWMEAQMEADMALSPEDKTWINDTIKSHRDWSVAHLKATLPALVAAAVHNQTVGGRDYSIATALDRTYLGVEALGLNLGPEVEAAVKEALTEAVVDVNVNFPAEPPPPEV